jgi:hypothetical protein
MIEIPEAGIVSLGLLSLSILQSKTQLRRSVYIDRILGLYEGNS